MITQDSIDTIRGATVFDDDGDKIGKVGEVYLDDSTGEPAWMTVTTGLFGTAQSFVPLQEASLSGDDVRVPYSKAKIKDAPRVDADGHLDVGEEDALYEYYGVGGASGGTADVTSGRTYETGTTTGTGFSGGARGEAFEDTTGVGRDETVRGEGYRDETVRGEGFRDETVRGEGYRDEAGIARGAVGHDTSGPTTDDAMTLSEERLQVGTQARESGRARLRKYVVTEQQSVNVPVSHEEVRLEREPITDANVGDALDGPAISEEEHEVILHEEVPVVSKEARPVERVRATTQTVTSEQQVSDSVRKERVDVDGDGVADSSLGERVRGREELGRDELGRDDLTR